MNRGEAEMIDAYERKKAEQLRWAGVLQKQIPGRNCCDFGCDGGPNCPVRETPLPPLDLAEQLPISVNLPPTRPTFAESGALTAFGWACTVAAIAGFFVTVYLRA